MGSPEDMPGDVYCYISFVEQVGGGNEKNFDVHPWENG